MEAILAKINGSRILIWSINLELSDTSPLKKEGTDECFLYMISLHTSQIQEEEKQSMYYLTHLHGQFITFFYLINSWKTYLIEICSTHLEYSIRHYSFFVKISRHIGRIRPRLTWHQLAIPQSLTRHIESCTPSWYVWQRKCIKSSLKKITLSYGTTYNQSQYRFDTNI